MDQSLAVEEVLPDIAFEVHFIFTYVANLCEHVATILLPRLCLGELDCNLAEKCIGIVIELRVINCVEHHKLELVCELTDKHALE